jgi:hypothetical protein
MDQLSVCAPRAKLTPVAITSLSIKRCSAPCKARRVAPPTRVVRAWPSGLDGASAPLAGGQLRDGHSLCGLDVVERFVCQESSAPSVHRIKALNIREGSVVRT